MLVLLFMTQPSICIFLIFCRHGSFENVSDWVKEIKDNGGEAVANLSDVQNGEEIAETAYKEYGRVDILINNAGITKDIAFKNMT